MNPRQFLRICALAGALALVPAWSSAQNPDSTGHGTDSEDSVQLKQPERTIGKRTTKAAHQPKTTSAVQRAEHQEILVEMGESEEEILPGAIELPPDLPASGTMYIDPQGTPGIRFWVSGEYLRWWAKGMWVPPLVTTSPAGTPGSQAGVLGQSTTQILYGDGRILTDTRNGFRIRFGTWFSDAQRLGLGGEYYQLFNESERFQAASDTSGLPILARPFFNMNPRDPITDALAPPAREDAEIVALPTLARGNITVESSSKLESGAGHLLWNACQQTTGCGSGCCGFEGQSEVSFLLGYRFAQLRERLRITESVTSLDIAAPGQFDIYDQFHTGNQFHGGELGVAWNYQIRRLSLQLLMKLALGSNRQRVDINGQTTFSTGPGSQTFQGGLLAQRTNIGNYSRNVFAVLPELGAKVGLNVTPRLRLTAGYTFLYWSRVVRPGEQIDLDVNPDLLPPEHNPFVGPLRPRFEFRDTDFWAQGLSAGVDFRW